MDLSVIIISWNVKDKLNHNLSAIFNSVKFNFEVIVVDNASTDGTLAMIKNNFPEVKLIANDKNLGFAKACNQGIKLATGRYVLLLNPDMKIMPNTLCSAVSWLDDNPQAAIAGIKLVDEQNKIVAQVRKLPQVFDQFLVASKLAHVLPFLMNNYLCSNFNYNQVAKVDSVRGSCFFIRRSTIEQIGLLDEKYFIWFEEVDYCHRAMKNNLEVWYTPVAVAIDYVGQSFKQVTKTTKQNYFKTSQLTYFEKWQPRWQVKILQFGWWLGGLVMKIVN